MICQDCKMNVVPDGRYHPHFHCTIWKTYHVDPDLLLRDHGYERTNMARPLPVSKHR